MLRITVLAFSALVGNALSAPAQLQTSVITGVEWSVKDFTRVCTTYPNACDYTFTIVPGGHTPNTTCAIVDTASNPVHNSIVSVPCNTADGKPWVISWGYNANYDFAVMTIVDEVEKQDAWFGYNCVSTTTDFEDAGPNKVYALGTFT